MLPKKKRIKIWCEGGQLNSRGFYDKENWVDSKKITRCHKCNKRLQPRTIDHNSFGDLEFVGYLLPPHKKLVKV
jgi:hypothetical protein